MQKNGIEIEMLCKCPNPDCSEHIPIVLHTVWEGQQVSKFRGLKDRDDNGKLYPKDHYTIVLDYKFLNTCPRCMAEKMFKKEGK